MRIHIIMHESFEAPGAILLWAEKNQHNVTYTKIYQSEKYPLDVDSFDMLIVMGGPQSPATTIIECPYYDAKSEIEFIDKAIKTNKILLGVCLGAQLIGEALGAKFDHSPNREIGVFDLNLTDDGKQDAFFKNLSQTFPVGHWHGDMPGLTPESKILAISEGCPRQIVRYTDKIYGFQCHFEFTKESIEGMINNSSQELEKYKDLPYVETAEQLRKHDFSEINSILYNFLDYIIFNFFNK